MIIDRQFPINNYHDLWQRRYFTAHRKGSPSLLLDLVPQTKHQRLQSWLESTYHGVVVTTSFVEEVVGEVALLKLTVPEMKLIILAVELMKLVLESIPENALIEKNALLVLAEPSSLYWMKSRTFEQQCAGE